MYMYFGFNITYSACMGFGVCIYTLLLMPAFKVCTVWSTYIYFTLCMSLAQHMRNGVHIYTSFYITSIPWICEMEYVYILCFDIVIWSMCCLWSTYIYAVVYYIRLSSVGFPNTRTRFGCIAGCIIALLLSFSGVFSAFWRKLCYGTADKPHYKAYFTYESVVYGDMER